MDGIIPLLNAVEQRAKKTEHMQCKSSSNEEFYIGSEEKTWEKKQNE